MNSQPLEVISNKERTNSFVLKCYLDEFLPKYKNILVVDTAGMGKSTLVKFLFLRAIEKNVGIPVLIELRKLSKEKSILDFICEELSSIDNKINKDYVASLIEKGNFIFFLDGYDEIQTEHRESVTLDLENFRIKADKNLFLLTSREERGLAAFPEFQRFNIRPLRQEEAFQLIKKYSRNESTYNALTAKILLPEYAQVQEFLTNPLLVSLLYKAFEYRPEVPLKRPIFYRQVFESLFWDHDFSKGGEFQRKKKSGLDSEQFHSMLRALGFVTFKEGKTEYDSAELIKYIDQAKQYCSGLSFTSSDFRNDLTNQVPLLIKDGNFYRWAHKSVQEYFAASYICVDTKEKETEVLLSIYNNEKLDTYLSMFSLCYDMDYKKFNQSVILQLAKDFVSFYDSSYLTIPPSINEKLTRARKEITAFKHIVFINTQNLIGANSSIEGNEEALHQAHMTASRLVEGKTGKPFMSSRSQWTNPIAICFVVGRLEGFINYLSSKEEISFISKSNTQVISAAPPPNIKFKKNNDFIYLDDSKANPLNASICFEDVTLMLANNNQTIFNYEECIKTIRKIETEIQSESKNNLNF